MLSGLIASNALQNGDHLFAAIFAAICVGTTVSLGFAISSSLYCQNALEHGRLPEGRTPWTGGLTATTFVAALGMWLVMFVLLVEVAIGSVEIRQVGFFEIVGYLMATLGSAGLTLLFLDRLSRLA